ncbi:unnamed protein product [Rhodiola kirilowii]
MADNEEIDANTVRGNEWEVVSLTASAYAAAPGPKVVQQGIDDEPNPSMEREGETSDTLFMSRHFAFPLNEKLPSEADKSLLQETEKDEDLVPELAEKGYKSSMKVDGDQNNKGLDLSDDSSELWLSEGKVNKQFLIGPDLEASETLIGLNAIKKEENLYNVAANVSLHADAPFDEKIDTPDLIESSERGSYVDADVSELVANEKEGSDETNLHGEAWWKRQAASLYAHAKETNTFWSIFIAAAVMGLAVIGHRWQKGKRQVLQLKLEVVVKDEKAGRVLQPISRLKDVIVGGSRANSFIRGASYEL